MPDGPPVAGRPQDTASPPPAHGGVHTVPLRQPGKYELTT